MIQRDDHLEMAERTRTTAYCVWDAADDTLIAFGTSKQCAEMLGMKCGSASFNQLKSKYKAGKIKKYIIMEDE